MNIHFSASLLRQGVLSVTLTASSLAQACGYTGGVGMESFFSPSSLIDVGILFFAGTALFLGVTEVLRRREQGRADQ